MTKADIAQKLAQATGLSQADTTAVIEGFIESVCQALAEGDHIEIRGFGTFKVVERAPRTGRSSPDSESSPANFSRMWFSEVRHFTWHRD